MQELTTQTYNAAIANNAVVVVRFYTNWCPDCRRTFMSTQALAARLKAKAAFFQIDADANAEVADALNIRGVPSFIVYRNGREVARLHSRDAKTPDQITRFVESALMQGGQIHGQRY